MNNGDNAKWCSDQRRENGQQRCHFYDVYVICVVRGGLRAFRRYRERAERMGNGGDMGEECWGNCAMAMAMKIGVPSTNDATSRNVCGPVGKI